MGVTGHVNSLSGNFIRAIIAAPSQTFTFAYKKWVPQHPQHIEPKKNRAVTNTTQTPNYTPHFPVGGCPSLVFCSLVFQYAARLSHRR